jgi:hypothetical protein
LGVSVFFSSGFAFPSGFAEVVGFAVEAGFVDFFISALTGFVSVFADGGVSFAVADVACVAAGVACVAASVFAGSFFFSGAGLALSWVWANTARLNMPNSANNITFFMMFLVKMLVLRLKLNDNGLFFFRSLAAFKRTGLLSQKLTIFIKEELFMRFIFIDADVIGNNPFGIYFKNFVDGITGKIL